MSEEAQCAHVRLQRLPIYGRPGLVIREVWVCDSCDTAFDISKAGIESALRARLAELEAEVARVKDKYVTAVNDVQEIAQQRDDAEGQRDSLARRNAELCDTLLNQHINHCTADWTDRGRHAPECDIEDLTPAELAAAESRRKDA